jgi:hypothetical protein
MENFVKPFCAYRSVTQFVLGELCFMNFSGLLTVYVTGRRMVNTIRYVLQAEPFQYRFVQAYNVQLLTE